MPKMSRTPEGSAAAIALPPRTDFDRRQSLDAMKTGLQRWLDATTTGDANAAPVTETMVRRKANELAAVLDVVDFDDDLSGWMSRWRSELVFSNRRGRPRNDRRRGLCDYGAADVYVLIEIDFDCPPNSRAAAAGTRERPLRLGVALACNATGTDRLWPAAVQNGHDPRSVRDVSVALDACAGHEWTVWDGYESFFDAWDRTAGRGVLVVLDDRVPRPSNADGLRHIALARFPRPPQPQLAAATPLTREIVRLAAAYESRLARLARPRPGLLSALDFMYLIADVWRCAPEPLVRNCLRACGLIRDAGAAEPVPPDTVDADFERWVARYRELREHHVLRDNLDVLRNRRLAASLHAGRRPDDGAAAASYSCDARKSVTAAVSTNVFEMPAGDAKGGYDYYFSIMQATAAQQIFNNCGGIDFI